MSEQIKSAYPEYQAYAVKATLKKDAAANNINGLPTQGMNEAIHHDFEKGEKVGVVKNLSPRSVELLNGQSHNTGIMYFPVAANTAKV